MVGRLSSIVARLPLSLVANALDEVLVEVADVKMTHTFIDVQLEFLLGYALLDPLAEGGVSRRSAASLAVLDQAAALAIKRWRRGTIVAVLLRAKPVHPALPHLRGCVSCQSPPNNKQTNKQSRKKHAVNTHVAVWGGG